MHQRHPTFDVHASREFDAGTYMGDDGILVQVAGGCHWYTQAPHACTSVSQQQQWSQQPYAQLQLEQEQQLMQQHSFVNIWYTVQQQQGQGQRQMYTPGQGQMQLQQHAVHSMQPSNQHEQQQQQQQQTGFILLPDGQTWQEVVWTPEIDAMYQEHKRHWEAAGYTYPYPSVPESMSHWQQAAEDHQAPASPHQSAGLPPADTDYTAPAETAYGPTATDSVPPAAGTDSEYEPPADTAYVTAADTEFVAPTDSELPAPEEEYYTLTELIEEKALRGRTKKLKKGQKQQQRRDDKVVELQDKVRSQQEAMDKLKLQVKNSTAFVAMVGHGLGKIIDMEALLAAAACSTEAIAEVIFRAPCTADTNASKTDITSTNSSDSAESTTNDTTSAPATPTTPTQAPAAVAAADTPAPKPTVLLRPSAVAHRPSPAAVLSTAATAAPVASSCGLKPPRPSSPKRGSGCPLPSLVTNSAAPAADTTQQQEGNSPAADSTQQREGGSASAADSTQQTECSTPAADFTQQQEGNFSASSPTHSPPDSPSTPDQDAAAVSDGWGPSVEVSEGAEQCADAAAGSGGSDIDMTVIIIVDSTSCSEGGSGGGSVAVVPVAEGGKCGVKGSGECSGKPSVDSTVAGAEGGECGIQGIVKCGEQCADSAVGMEGCSGVVKRSFLAALMQEPRAGRPGRQCWPAIRWQQCQGLQGGEVWPQQPGTQQEPPL